MILRTVIFDLDGTIANTLPLCIAAFRESIEPLLKQELSDEEIIASFGPSEEGTIRQLVPQYEQAGIQAYLQHYKELHYTCPVPFDGIANLLAFLDNKGIQLAMVTGKGPHSTVISLQQFGLSKYFEVMETGSPEGPVKVAGIRKVLERLGADVKESLYVGDAPSDINYCKVVGIPIAAAAWAETTDVAQLTPLQPDYIFYTVDEFKKWLEGVLV